MERMRRERVGKLHVICRQEKLVPRAAACPVREQFGLEATQATLGQSRASVTEIYAKANEDRAVEVALSIG
jgi:hypothetical protein